MYFLVTRLGTGNKHVLGSEQVSGQLSKQEKALQEKGNYGVSVEQMAGLSKDGRCKSQNWKMG